MDFELSFEFEKVLVVVVIFVIVVEFLLVVAMDDFDNLLDGAHGGEQNVVSVMLVQNETLLLCMCLHNRLFDCFCSPIYIHISSIVLEQIYINHY